MSIFYIAATCIRAHSDPESGQQTLHIQATALGTHLAHVLAGDDVPTVSDGYFILPHNGALDARLCDLIDVGIALRYSHPQLLQLRLFQEGE